MEKIKLLLKKYRILIVVVITVIALIGIGFGTYKYNKVQAYNNLVTTANKYMVQGYYDKAEALFEQSLKYKKDSSIEKNIKLAATLEKFKGIYSDGMKLVNDKKYLEAIKKFKTIDKSGLKWYTNAQKEIKECKKQYIAQNIQLANDSAKNNKYDDANKYLDDILKVDSNNADAKKLKNSVAEAINENQKNSKVKQEVKQSAPMQNNTGKVSVQNNSNTSNKTDEYASKIRDIDNEIYEVKFQIQHMDSTSEEYRQALQQEINLIQQKNELLGQMQK
jgi:tetratricopeptide (TPR) repeat protein